MTSSDASGRTASCVTQAKPRILPVRFPRAIELTAPTPRPLHEDRLAGVAVAVVAVLHLKVGAGPLEGPGETLDSRLTANKGTLVEPDETHHAGFRHGDLVGEFSSPPECLLQAHRIHGK